MMMVGNSVLAGVACIDDRLSMSGSGRMVVWMLVLHSYDIHDHPPKDNI